MLTLNADSTWKLERTERDVCGNKTEEETETETGRYRLTGSNMRCWTQTAIRSRTMRGMIWMISAWATYRAKC